MTEQKQWIDQPWVPDACTLPSSEQPHRVEEFDDLFRDATTAVQRIDAGRARLVLRSEPAIAARTADLVVREAQCCSFFAFTLSVTGGQLSLDIAAPPGQAAVLDEFLVRARSAAGLVTG